MHPIDRSRFALTLLAGFGVALTLVGCAATNDQPPLTWTAPESSHRSEVVPTVARTELRAVPGNPAALTQDQAARLDAFMRANLASSSAHVTLRQQGTGSLAGLVRSHLISRGIPPRNIVVVPSPGGYRAGIPSVQVEVAQYLVRVPECGDWSKPPALLDDTHTHSNFGCAMTRNLDLMVADPADLMVGQNSEIVDGQPQASAMDRYRTDKITPLSDDQSFSASK